MANATDTHDRIMAGFADLQQRLAEETDPHAPERAAELAARAVAAGDAAILAEYAAHGLVPIMGDGRPVSLSLARLMNLPIGEVCQMHDRWMEAKSEAQMG